MEMKNRQFGCRSRHEKAKAEAVTKFNAIHRKEKKMPSDKIELKCFLFFSFRSHKNCGYFSQKIHRQAAHFEKRTPNASIFILKTSLFRVEEQCARNL
jgi:hypothetical protein